MRNPNGIQVFVRYGFTDRQEKERCPLIGNSYKQAQIAYAMIIQVM